ncbi:S8 family serine peptidase, partial [Alkalihalophilus pseudofirmus]
DPMETLTAGKATIHGTHVAGVIAANGKIKGVAPEAKIVAYRALGPGGGGTTEQVLAAIDQAIKDKVDIINLSLGNSINGPDLPISLALDRAVN